MIEISLDGIRWEEAARGEFANIQNNPVEQQVISGSLLQHRLVQAVALGEELLPCGPQNREGRVAEHHRVAPIGSEVPLGHIRAGDGHRVTVSPLGPITWVCTQLQIFSGVRLSRLTQRASPSTSTTSTTAAR